MASIVSVVVSDDIDGSPDAESVSLGLERVSYEIDLSDKSRAKLDKALAPFIEHSRRVSRTSRRTARRKSARSSRDNTIVRAWAREHGLKVSERGRRISADVIHQYEEAH
jgi:hypothetical protein